MQPTITAALRALETSCGFLEPRSSNIARELQNANLLPLGTPQEPPRLDHDQFVTLFLALAADIDSPLRAAPENARRFGAMTPGGTAVPEDQERIPTTAAEYLEVVVADALDDQLVEGVRNSQFEIVATSPELLHYGSGRKARRFQPLGSIPGVRSSAKAWKSTTIPGRAFVATVRHLFAGEIL